MTPTPKLNRRGRWLLTLLVLAGLTATVACSSEAEHEAGPARSPIAPVTTAVIEAQFTKVALIARATGSVEPWRTVSPGTKILGRIERFHVREGEAVRSGQLLVEFEKRDLEAAVQQARSGVGMATAQFENAKAHRDRIAALHARGSATDKNLEDVVAGLRVAEAGLEQAEANLRVVEVSLEYAEIRAPIAGWVVIKMAEAGDMASPGRPLLTIEDTSRVRIGINVPEADVAALAPGSPLTVRIDVLDREVDARIDRIVPAGSPGSRTFKVEVVLDNPDGALKSGMFARAEFKTGSREALTVPATALVSRGQLYGVWVVDPAGLARLRWVKPGRDTLGGIEILSGLDAGERLVANPTSSLVDGTPIQEG